MGNRESISRFSFRCPSKAADSVVIDATYNHSTGLLQLSPRVCDYEGERPLARIDEASEFCTEHEGNYFYFRDVMAALGGGGVDTRSIVESEGVQEGVDALRGLPPAQWNDYIGGVPQAYADVMAKALNADALGAARLAAYTNARCLGMDHGRAVAYTNKKVKAVAKAMGYAYPDSHELTF